MDAKEDSDASLRARSLVRRRRSARDSRAPGLAASPRPGGDPPADASPIAAPSGVEVIAAGLTNPRGFAWSSDGTLYLALAGNGGATTIPAAEGFTASIGLSSSEVTIADGCTTPVAVGLVSALWEEAGWIWGAMDVAFLGEELYVLVSGAG